MKKENKKEQKEEKKEILSISEKIPYSSILDSFYYDAKGNAITVTSSSAQFQFEKKERGMYIKGLFTRSSCNRRNYHSHTMNNQKLVHKIMESIKALRKADTEKAKMLTEKIGCMMRELEFREILYLNSLKNLWNFIKNPYDMDLEKRAMSQLVYC